MTLFLMRSGLTIKLSGTEFDSKIIVLTSISRFLYGSVSETLPFFV